MHIILGLATQKIKGKNAEKSLNFILKYDIACILSTHLQVWHCRYVIMIQNCGLLITRSF